MHVATDAMTLQPRSEPRPAHGARPAAREPLGDAVLVGAVVAREFPDVGGGGVGVEADRAAVAGEGELGADARGREAEVPEREADGPEELHEHGDHDLRGGRDGVSVEQGREVGALDPDRPREQRLAGRRRGVQLEDVDGHAVRHREPVRDVEPGEHRLHGLGRRVEQVRERELPGVRRPLHQHLVAVVRLVVRARDEARRRRGGRRHGGWLCGALGWWRCLYMRCGVPFSFSGRVRDCLDLENIFPWWWWGDFSLIYLYVLDKAEEGLCVKHNHE